MIFGPRQSGSTSPDLTIVCCIEFGRLEEQTVLMVRSLRAFGGVLADVPVMAVIGRSGARLRQETRRELERLGVRIVRARRADNPAPWLNYANKIAAVLVADRLAETAQVSWFDSDMFVMQEPHSIILGEEQDLAAQCHHLPPAVLDGDPAHVGYWTTVCALYGVNLADVPWTRAADHMPLQMLNFTSGLFTWWRGSGFAQHYADAVTTLLNARVAQSTGEFFTADQVVFTPLIVRDRLRWKAFSVADHSIVLGSFLNSKARDIPDLKRARILHYSNAFAPPYRSSMGQLLEREVPEFASWLRDQKQKLDLGRMPLSSRALAFLLRSKRGIQYELYARSTVRAA